MSREEFKVNTTGKLLSVRDLGVSFAGCDWWVMLN